MKNLYYSQMSVILVRNFRVLQPSANLNTYIGGANFIAEINTILTIDHRCMMNSLFKKKKVGALMTNYYCFFSSCSLHKGAFEKNFHTSLHSILSNNCYMQIRCKFSLVSSPLHGIYFNYKLLWNSQKIFQTFAFSILNPLFARKFWYILSFSEYNFSYENFLTKCRSFQVKFRQEKRATLHNAQWMHLKLNKFP